MLSHILSAVALLIFGSWAYSLFSNYQAARKFGLPIIILPFSWQFPLWPLIQPLCTWMPQTLPFGMGQWVRYSMLGWSFNDLYETHSRLGPAFVLVSAWKTEVIIADMNAVETVMKNPRAWMNDPVLFSLFDVFGPQIMSVNGNDWQRHRKVTGAAFKEENARAVWYASLRQAEAWSKVIASRQGEDVITLAKATELTHVVALHVLSAGGFGRECDFEKGTTQPEEGHSMSYGQSLSVIMQNILMTAILFSALKLPRIILPAALKKLSIAVDEFGKYMKERVEDVKQGALSDLTVKGNLMSALVEANESEKQEAAKGTSTGSFLTDEEMYGNLFMYNVAGYETTANALAFALPLLAGYPKVQEWVFEEVSEVFETGGDEVTYEDGFPKLVRTLAIMHEILRRYSTVPTSIRSNGPHSQTLRIGDRTCVLPPHTFATMNFSGIHNNPGLWGADCRQWIPSRWIQKSTDGNTREVLVQPAIPGAFIGWSTGPRICPGKKFSQAEFVAVIATLLRHYRIEPNRKPNENMEAARARVLLAVDEGYHNISPKLRNPDRAAIVFVKR